MYDFLLAILLIIGGGFGLIGSYGLLKLPDLMTRLHAPTKATTVGVGSLLLASMLHGWLTRGTVSFQEPLIAVFLLITAPVTAHFIAKAHLHRRVAPGALPQTGTPAGWAGHAAPPAAPDEAPAA